MTIINRALHKAYQRRAESEPVPEKERAVPTSVSGWASKLREPIQPLDRQAAAIKAVVPAGAPIDIETGRVDTGRTDTVRIDMSHSPVAAQAEAPPMPAMAALPAEDLPRAVEPWSWPSIVERLLTCPAAAELRDLAVRLRELAAGSDLRCVAFSGPGRNVGRTSLVLTLASVLIADKETRVAIVDADFNHPQAAQLISLPFALGLEELLNNPEFADGVVTTLIADRLAIVPLAQPIAMEAIDHRRIGTLQTFLRSLRREYDLVLIDAGPWESAHPTPVLECRAVDAAVCVCRVKSSRDEPADEANFRQPGVEWLGVIETFVKAEQLDSRHN